MKAQFPAIFKNIFSNNDFDFNELALQIFHFQYQQNKTYKEYCDFMKVDISSIDDYSNIPFLPIEFFKSKKITTTNLSEKIVFESSTTTGLIPSKHYIIDEEIYVKSCVKSFENHFAHPENYLHLALLPNYLERGNSSLVYMVQLFMNLSKQHQDSFYLNDLLKLKNFIENYKGNKKIILWGVTYALLQLAEIGADLSDCFVIETGGMKGRGKELIRTELYEILKSRLNLSFIYSEYGMTELLSQAYSKEEGVFYTPKWMKVLCRDPFNPIAVDKMGKGVLNIIDLANIYSCSFIATQDLGNVHAKGTFEVLGRTDSSDTRGCNLLSI